MEDKVEISLKFGRQMMTQILSRIKYSSRNVKSQLGSSVHFLFSVSVLVQPSNPHSIGSKIWYE